MLQEILILLLLLLTIIAFFVGRFTKSKTAGEKQIGLQAEINFLNQQITSIQNEKNRLDEQLEILRQDNQELIARISIRDTEYSNLKEKLEQQHKETITLQEEFSIRFENLANKIFEEKSEKFTNQNKNNLETLLTPLSDKIHHFEQKIEQTHKESIDYHAVLRQQIIGLQQTNQKMSEETLNLTKALKGDNKMQGNWGEMILENILEKSGLQKGREYQTQQSFSTENNSRLQPDVIINLPDNRHLIIDSKVSLTAYEQFINSSEEKEKQCFLQEHLLSVKRHVERLSEKNYFELYPSSSPDFVLLFIPIETAFSIAVNTDTSLYTKAFEKNIVIVTPSTLLATLRTIETMWKQRKQQENSYEIARQAGLLYDKFEGFISDLNKLGKKLDDAKSEYDNAFNKLSSGRGNMINTVQKLKDMGAKTKKDLDRQLIDKAREEL
ncbi:DNA recombination protein RmuC [Myroides indicus]|uniref:DNA recombination protein RmuC n=1 Tax=Myroides indicus TaxID=1323422 RepID=A0A4R7ES54_9FLAO|nr:DNA recombination protein RmuC [Myroides indicus]TDS50834.1 DNA recombination protein RmuC [Myroides indicus]